MNEAESPNLPAAPPDSFGTIDDLDCKGRRVFLRVDPYVIDTLSDSSLPVSTTAEPDSLASSTGGAVAASLAQTSLERLIELEARVIVATHISAEAAVETGLGDVEALAARLSERLGVEALMPDECVGDAASRVIHALRPAQICVLPDLMGSAGELRNDEGFARALAGYVDAYVGDSFAASHLPYASLVRLPRLAPRRALGYRARHELGVLSRLFASGRGSVAMVLGGNAMAGKIEPVSAWLSRLDKLYVGGGAAVTLLAASGRAPAHASAEPTRLAEARSLLTRARDMDVELLLPVDLWVQMPNEAERRVVSPRDLSAEARVIDIGPASALQLAAALDNVPHLLWWGPLGNLSAIGGEGSLRVAEACARPNVTSVVMGSDTRRFVRQLPADLRANIDLVTTGTEAAIALLSGRRLPGLEALRGR